MLGRLLHLGSGSQPAALSLPHLASAQPILSLESVQEDIHTRNLLFPDAHALYQHRNDQVFPLSTAPATPSTSSVHAFDYSDDVELDVKDVRVIIMQDALGPTNASLLYDSHPLVEALHSPDRPERSDGSSSSPDFKKGPQSPRRGGPHNQPSRHAVNHSVNHVDPPQTRQQGAFDRRASGHGRSLSFAETDVQKAAREYREELATFSSCIFGNSELMAYKGTSTKVHVVPCEPRVADHAGSILGDGRSSIGRSSGRSSKLSQSYSSQAVSPPFPTTLPAHNLGPPRHSDRKKVLITRLFPVTLTAEDLETSSSSTPPGRYSDDHSGFPFPLPGDEASPKRKPPQPKQRRTPMYAIVLVVQLPPSPSRVSSAVPQKPLFREPGSYNNDHEMFSSSYNSTRMFGWNMSGSGLYGDAMESSFSIDVEDRIDSLTQHWDIIMRTLTHLQSVVTSTLHTMLKSADVASPAPSQATAGPVSRIASQAERRGEVRRIKPPKSTVKLVFLLPNCLTNEKEIASEVGLARSRIVMGLSAARVITGQGRWGIWRDEAIWTCRWAASKGQDLFLHTLLTGFLATHTDWLQALCHSADRRRALDSRQARNDDDLSLPARTIIVSDDKMAARRIIFLLSAFLPTNQQLSGARAHRPSTSASLTTFSNSPPTYIVPVLREESLRRKINRRPGWRRASHSRTVSSQGAKTAAVANQLGHLSMEHSGQRRASDAASIRTTSLPIPGNDFVSRKSNPATATAILQETTMPHFTSVQRSDGQARTRPGSSCSVAADDLKRSLKRGESCGTVSGRPTSQGMKWGNVISGLWTHRRESMDSGSAYSQASDLRSPVKPALSRPDKLSEMVRELSLAEEAECDRENAQLTAAARDVVSGQSEEGFERKRRSFAQLDRTPDPTGAFESPVKTSINADDGVIDVDVPFPDYIASFESAISSPSSSGYLSTPGLPILDSFEHSGRIAIDGDLPLNVAGWLNKFHPDFAMQATPPQEGLLDKVMAALRAEPTPLYLQQSRDDDVERWVDVSSAVIADTTTDTVKRISYRRLVRFTANHDKPIGRAGSVPASSTMVHEGFLDEKFIEETVICPDELLMEALDRVVSLGADTRRDTPFPPHPPHVDVPVSSDSTTVALDTVSEMTTQMADPPLDIPRVQCKTVMLSVLEDTIREVVDGQDGEDADSYHRRRRNRYQSVLRDAVKQWADNLDSNE